MNDSALKLFPQTEGISLVMKLFKNILGFRNYRLAIHLPWLALACFLWIGNSQQVVANSSGSDKKPVMAQAKVPGKAQAPAPAKAPVKLRIKVLAPAPVKAPVKLRIKVLAPAPEKAPVKLRIKVLAPAPVKAPEKAPVKAPAVKAPAVKVKVPRVAVASIAQTGFGFSQAAENLKSTVDSIMLILSNEYFQKNTTARRQVLWEILGAQIDFKRMARRSLAGEWAIRSPQEKKQFVRLFKKLLEQSYVRWIEGFKEGRVHYLSERVKGRYAKVRTRIFEADQSVDVEYKLVRQKNGWRVYDFTVQGVSVVRNYRAQFAKVLDRESYQGLVRKLQAQVG